MTRRAITTLACGLVAGLLALDLLAAPPDPYAAPPLFALGSGAAPAGGFCGAPAFAAPGG